MSFGSRLREARMEMGLSQKEFANKIGVANTAISNYEKDISFPNTDILYKIFEVLQRDANFLFQDVINDCKADICTSDMFLTDHEKKLVEAYRNHPDMQPAINKMLDIEENTSNIFDDIADELKQSMGNKTVTIK